MAYRAESLSVPRLLHWHRELCGHAGPEIAGRFKRYDNRVQNPDGSDRFKTVPAAIAEATTVMVIDQIESALQYELGHPLIVIPAFILDFLVIHPFDDGNGRMARLAAHALMSRSGYTIGRYCSIEGLLHTHRHRYYETLRQSTVGWHDATHTVWPWVEFFIDVVYEGYATTEQGLNDAIRAASSESPSR